MKKSKKNYLLINLLLSLLFIMIIVPCNITEAAAIKLNKTAVQLAPKQSYTLKVSGTAKTIKWSSSNAGVATVSSRGKVTAKKSGTAVITAKIGSKRYSCKVLVSAKNKIIPLGKENQIFLGKVYKETWQHVIMGKETSYILKLVNPVKYRTESGTIRTVSEIHLFSSKNYSPYVGKNVFVKGYTTSQQTIWYRRELNVLPDRIY